MKILHININFSGRPMLHGCMLEHLDQTGINNEVFVPVENHYSENYSTYYRNNVYIVRCFNKWDRFLFDYKQYKIKKALVKCIDFSAIDCIHAHTLFSDGNTARDISQRYSIPYIVAVRNTDVNVFFKYAYYLRGRGLKIMLDASAVVFLSKAYRDFVIKKYVPKIFQDEILDKSVIIPNGIDDFWFENKNIPKTLNKADKKIRLIYAGEITKNKNVISVQKAAQILRQRGYEVYLNVVGNVVDNQDFERIKADKKTIYTPRIVREKLINYYKNSDIFVMPSFTESFGLVYAEAMSQGLPVIYTVGQGFDEQFLEGEVGFHVDPYRDCDIADKIELIMKDYDNFSKRCLRNVEKFKWIYIVKQYESLYKKVIC